MLADQLFQYILDVYQPWLFDLSNRVKAFLTYRFTSAAGQSVEKRDESGES